MHAFTPAAVVPTQTSVSLPLWLVLPVFVVSAAIGLAITQPFHGALVRIRANYLQRGVALAGDDDDGEAACAAKVGINVRGVFSMLARTKRLEGYSGLYRGIGIGLLNGLWLQLLAWAVLAGSVSALGLVEGAIESGALTMSHVSFVIGVLAALILSMAALPLHILENRVIAHSHKLPFSAPSANLRVLLTPHELRNPLRLYAVPGVVACTLTLVFWRAIVLRLAARALLGPLAALIVSLPPQERPPVENQPNIQPDAELLFTAAETSQPSRQSLIIRIVAFLAFCAVSLVVLVPVESALVRLSVQRPLAGEVAPVDVADHAQDDPPTPSTAATEAGTPEPVIALRPAAFSGATGAAAAGAPDVEPYKSMLDCLTKMCREEGAEALRRGWWMSLLAVPFASLG